MRLPAEWERQRATLLAWPDARGDWADCLAEIRAEYAALIETLLAHQAVIVLVGTREEAASLPQADHPGLHPVIIPFDDTWCRDYGPICLLGESDRSLALDFRFDAWGGKYESGQDDQVNLQLLGHPLLADFERIAVDLELEGGAIEPDGCGRILVNWFCLEKRLPGCPREQIAERLQTALRLEAVLGIDVPALPGDDTDGHIDTIARFAGPRRIVYQQHQDQAWTRALREELESLRRSDGGRYELIPLPGVEGFDPGLPANYANFLFVNGACLVPAYGVDSDRAAIRQIAELFPDREVLSVPARTMITQFGGPHCATMHIPDPKR
jgi:agmatine/peptidylarginine deiminase